MTFSVRLRFRKEGLVRFISHLDFTKSILRGMARSGVPFIYTQGYSPRPKVSFGPPLSLGWESETEMMEIEFAEKNDWKYLSQKINENLPKGLKLVEIVFVDKKGLLNKEIKYIVYSIGLPKGFNKELLEKKLSIKFTTLENAGKFSCPSDSNLSSESKVNFLTGFTDKIIEISQDYDRSKNDLAKDYFTLKVEESVKMKDILNEISESSEWFYIFVKRLAFYDKNRNRI